jgi:prepilin-type N-terminal cleavage/methylation domain-containing protein
MSASNHISRNGHTLIELVVAMVAGAVLLAGLGSVMLIARQVAYTPSGASRRTEAGDILGQLTDELQYATMVIGQSTNVLEFVVRDRNADGTAEKIRYSWSGVAGDPLLKSINGGSAVTVLDSVNNFNATYLLETKSSTLTTTAESAETLLASNASVQDDGDRDINTLRYSAQQINPAAFSAIPANVKSWNATRIEFYGRDNSSDTETLLVQLRNTGDPGDCPTSDVVGQVSIPESALGSEGWKSAVFASPVRGLVFHRRYAVVWAGLGGDAARLPYGNSGGSGVWESNDGGGSWQSMTARQLYWRIYGTYSRAL